MFCHGASPSLPPLLTLVPTLLFSLVLFLLFFHAMFCPFSLTFTKMVYQLGWWAQLCAGVGLMELSRAVWHGAASSSPHREVTCSLPLPTPGDICTQNTKAFMLSAALSSNSQQHGRRGADNHRCTYRSKSYPSCSNLTISLPAHFSLISVFPTSVARQEGYRESYRAYPIQLTQ